MKLEAKQFLVTAIVSFFTVLTVNSYAEVSTMGAKGS